MKAELQNKLIKKYPKFFEYLKDYQGPIMPIQFGFECGDGWYILVDSLMDCIYSYIDNKEKYPDKRIKSKIWRHIMPKLDKASRHNTKFWKIVQKIKKNLEMENIPAPYVQLTQLKEKYGGLRFYINGGDDYIDGMISLAEDLSFRTCEFCGSTENVGQTQGWLTTICKSCFDKGLTSANIWKPNKD